MYNLIKEDIKINFTQIPFIAKEGIIIYTYGEKISTLVKQLARKRKASDVKNHFKEVSTDQSKLQTLKK